MIGERKSSKTFEFSNVSINLNTKPYFKIESTNTENIREDYVSFYEVKKMLKFDTGNIAVLGDDAAGISVSFAPEMRNFFSTNGQNNKLYVYEITGNFGKTKIGEKTSAVMSNSRNDVNFSNNKVLEKGKSYLVEFTNGTSTVNIPFVYFPINSSVSEVKETSAKFTWSYPSGYQPASGDRVEIFLRIRQVVIPFHQYQS